MFAHALRSTALDQDPSHASDAAAVERLDVRDRVLYRFLVRAGGLEPAAAAARTLAFFEANAHPWRRAAA